MHAQVSHAQALPWPTGTPNADNAESPPPDPSAGALEALCVLARLHHVAADPAQIRHQLGRPPSEAITTADLLTAAAHIGLRAKQATTTAPRLPLTPLPALALMRDGSVLLLAQCDGQRVLLQSFTASQGG